jgi:hypothetical protein
MGRKRGKKRKLPEAVRLQLEKRKRQLRNLTVETTPLPNQHADSKNVNDQNDVQEKVSPPSSVTLDESKEGEKQTVTSDTKRRIKWAITIIGLFIWPFRKKNLFATASIILCGGFIASFFYFGRSTPTNVSARFTQLRDVEFTYDKYQGETISPLCGCFREVAPDEWRGITFAARYIEIKRESDKPFTGYLLSSPSPGQTFWLPDMFQTRVTLYSITLPIEKEFDPRWILDKTKAQDYDVVKSQTLGPEEFFVLISKKELNVALLGDKPIGAWIPADGSRVAVLNQPLMRLSVQNIAHIEESYNYAPKPEFEKLMGRSTALPLGDFLGPLVNVT